MTMRSQHRCDQRLFVKRNSVLARVCFVWAALIPWVASAQLAPTGTHYAGRPSDTGHTGPNAQGGYSTTIALDFPAARGGLPIPVQVVSGTKGFGAAGVGWDVPLSFVLVDRSFGHRRPAKTPDAAPVPRDRVTVALPGRQVEMVPQGGHWIGRTAPDLLLKDENGKWVLYDGRGLTYTFAQDPLLAGTGGPYAGRAGLWLLETIRGPGKAMVLLEHHVEQVHSPGDPVPSVSVDLVRVKYNPHPSAGCYKHEIALLYGNAVVHSTRKSLSIVGDRVLGRYRKLDAVEVLSRPACSTDTPLQRLRFYELKYQVDPDAQQERLVSVKMFGRKNTSEELVSLPVAEYAYGRASSPASGGRDVLRYDNSAAPTRVELPQGANVLAQSHRVSTSVFASPISSSSKPSLAGSSILDMTGDGRPDLVFRKNNQLWISRNVPSPSGMAAFAPPVLLTDAVLTTPFIDARSSDTDRFHAGQLSITREYVWRQSIDVNGDGRIDIVDAAEEPRRWMIYLNTPDSGASGIKWVKRAIDVGPVYDRLAGAGMAVESGYVPLSRRYTSRDHEEWMCWRWDPSVDKYVLFPAGLPSPLGLGLAAACADLNGVLYDGPEKTYTEWELTDVNGDGYPDLVYNSSPVDIVVDQNPEWTTEFDGQLYRLDKLLFEVRPVGHSNGRANAVKALLNVLGVRLSHPPVGSRGFSSPVDLIENDECGVAQWTGTTSQLGTLSSLACGFLDVNGDGIADRLEWRSAQLGTGFGFDTTRVSLPALLQQHSMHHHYLWGCPKPGTPWDPNNPTPASYAFQTAALRDMNGDGIPDFVERTDTGYKVYVGTGAGFAGSPLGDGTYYPGAVLDVEGSFGISHVDEACSGDWSRTASGLYDLNADGKPEYVALSNAGTWHLKAYPLIGGSVPGNPEAGKLIEIRNGYGAVTQISYRSAKQDEITKHQVPFPEIVVAKTATHATNQPALGTPLAPTYYAYGNIDLFYDPVVDRFRSTGYLRRVEVVSAEVPGLPGLQVTANVIDHYGLQPFSALSSAEERFARYQLIGRVSAVTTLAGTRVNSDAWALLSINVNTHTLRTAVAKYDMKARWYPEPAAPWHGFADCLDIMFPYDFDTSVTYNGSQYNPCSSHGFVYASTASSWRGSAAPPSTSNVRARSSVRDIDEYGRVTALFLENDLADPDDDVCVETSYAAPTGPDARVLTAISTRRVSACGAEGNARVVAVESWEYDKLPVGLTTAEARVTAHTVYRRATDTGEHLGTVRQFDADYDANGNPIRIAQVRDSDNANRTVNISYDSFALTAVHTAQTGTNVPTLNLYRSVDPVTGAIMSSTDANGTTRGIEYDGFGRAKLETIDTPDGSKGVMAFRDYLGFLGGSQDGRRIRVKEFTNPVPRMDVMTEAGRLSVTHLDEFGRPRFTRIELGGDYGHEKLIVGARTYDPFGRTLFEADPYTASQDPTVAYGTTKYFAPDGSLSLSIRGRGPQPFITAVDDTLERYPTLFRHWFTDHREFVASQGPDALVPGSPQYGVAREASSTAIGRVVARSTWQNSTRIEHATFRYDRLGARTKIVRYRSPSALTGPVAWSSRFDSMGQLIALSEPASAPQERTYSSFGELQEVRWKPQLPLADHSIVQTYDAFGRPTHYEEQLEGAADPETIREYTYDIAGASALITPTFTLGRLTSARTPTSHVVISYDGYGRPNARSYRGVAGLEYIERHRFHGDGSHAWIELNLPDNAYAAERIDYEYDSAARLRWIWYSDGTDTEELYTATDMDAWGRVRMAFWGKDTTYTAKYAELGRRLPQEISVSSGPQQRALKFVSFDPVGRELARAEQAASSRTETHTYDYLGRLSSTMWTQGGATTGWWTFNHDALGNLTGLHDMFSGSVVMATSTTDPDRIETVSYSGVVDGVSYNSVGNIERYPTASGYNSIKYYKSGDARVISNESDVAAAFTYDAFGSIESLRISRAGRLLRADYRHGPFILERKQEANGNAVSYVSRQFPAGGFGLSRRGATGPWIVEFGDQRGTRFTLNSNGAFVQDFVYAPFGKTASSGASPGTLDFTSEQWNVGDALDSLAVVHLGKRLYDPAIGRFLSRDPLLVPRTSSTSNPYAFAFNDPINFSDPSGLDPDACSGYDCNIFQTYVLPSSSPIVTLLSFGAVAATLYSRFGKRPDPPEFASQVEQHAYYTGYADALDGHNAYVQLGWQEDIASVNQAFDQLGVFANSVVPGSRLITDQLGQASVQSYVTTYSWSWEQHLAHFAMNVPVFGNFFSAGVHYSAGNYGTAGLHFILGSVEIATLGASRGVFSVGPYRPSATPLKNHHGVLDVWAANNVPGYVQRGTSTPTIALTKTQHEATNVVYREWLFERTGKRIGGYVDWTTVGPREMQNLANRMFDAAGVPQAARAEYFRAFNQYIYRTGL
jgi:RHS repeat-associated protein